MFKNARKQPSKRRKLASPWPVPSKSKARGDASEGYGLVCVGVWITRKEGIEVMVVQFPFPARLAPNFLITFSFSSALAPDTAGNSFIHS